MLASGTRIGPYEVVSSIGAGGMGEVYRAKDTRLARDVAIKVLPTSFAADPERLRRFEQEARAAGMLNHPNILAVHDFGAYNGAPYVVTELLEGQTLRDRIGGSPLPVRKAVDYAIQMARGLAAAHDKGIVHRDLKPDNLFVTREGRVKILDFGLAKSVPQAALATAETAMVGAAPSTEAGMVLGTASYMSPEQVRAQPVDHRSDIFSFGVVLYEMLTGKGAFQADSAIETMSAILKADPPRIADVTPGLPPDLERIVLHCLEKNAEERFQSAGDIAFHLESLSGSSSSAGRRVQVAPSSSRLKGVAFGAFAVMIGAALFLAGRATVRPTNPEFEPITFRRGSVPFARYAPDGRTVVYTAAWEGTPNTLYTAQAGNPESRSLDVQGLVRGVSKAGELAIQIRRPGQPDMLARMPLNGGAPRDVLEDLVDANWDSKGEEMVVVRNVDGRQRIEFPIGRVVLELTGWASSPIVSSDNQRIAFAAHPIVSDNRGDIVIVDMSGKVTTLSSGWEDIGQLAWSPDEREIWFSGSKGGIDHSIHAVTLGGATRLLLAGPGSLSLQDVTRDGRVVISHGVRRPGIVVKLAGSAHEVELGWMDYSWLMDLSEDGKYILFSEQGTAGGPGYAVYRRGTDGSPAVRLGKGDAHSLSHDGKWALASDLETHTLHLLPTGAGQQRSLPKHEIATYAYASFCPDDRRIIIAGTDQSGTRRMYVQDLQTGNLKAVTPAGVAVPQNTISPDGKQLALIVRGTLQMYPVDGGEPRAAPGAQPGDRVIRWSGDGSSVFVATGQYPTRVFAINLTTGARTLLHELAPRDPVGASGVADIKMTPDGKSYAFGYVRILQNLYQVTGLR